MFRPTATLAMMILLLYANLVPATSTLFPAFPTTHATTRNIFLDGRSIGWNSTRPGPTITVTEADTVALSLTAGDSIRHQFFVDVNRNTQIPPDCPPDKCSPDFNSPTTPTAYSFPVDFVPGNYLYYCTYHSGQMYGNFIVQPAFIISSNPTVLAIPQGSSRISTITLTSVDGFSGTASLVTGASPAGPNPSLNPMSVDLSASGTATSTLTVDVPTGTADGTYNVQVNATINGITHITNVMVTVGADFNIMASPDALTIPRQSARTSIITISSLNNYAGTVTLATSVSPAGTDPSVDPTRVMITMGGTGTSVVTVSVPPATPLGNYVITVTGTDGTRTHSSSVTVSVADFSITAGPSSLPTIQGSSGTSTIMITSLNGFFGNVDLAATVSPSGPGEALSPLTVTLTAGGNGVSTLTISTNGGLYPTTTGNYIINVTGTYGQLSHSVIVTVMVTQGFSPVPAMIGGVIAVILVAAVTVYLYRRSKSKRPSP